MSILQKYVGPWGGFNTSMPDSSIPPQDTPSMNNVILKQNYLCSRPPFTPNVLPQWPELSPCRAVASALKPDGYYVTYGIDNANVYILTTDATAWNGPIPLPAMGLSAPNYVQALNNLYFVNMSQYILYNNAQILTNLYGARYIFELAQSLVIADTIEAANQEFPQRVRWSVAGNISDWSSIGAGFNDLIDIDDEITGTLSLGSVAYILHKNGITQMTPTGNGINPFYFNHLWASEHGIGLYFPQTMCSYGSVGFIVCIDNIYTFTLSSFQSIADNCLDNILADIYSANGPNIPGTIFSWVLPVKYSTTTKQIYLLYEIAVNGPGNQWIIWSYSTRNKNWMRSTLPVGDVLTAPANAISYKVNI